MSGWGSVLSAVIPAAASLGSAYFGANASRDAARRMEGAADRAADVTQGATDRSLDLQRFIYDQNRSDLGPWRQAGQNALQGLMADWGGNYQASPSYDWRMSEGLRAVDAGMSARGLRNSTARDRAAGRFAEGLASQDYENWWNRGAGLAGVGQAATGQGVAAGANYAGQASNTLGTGAANLANIYGQGANAGAAGTIGQANAWGGALTNLATRDNVNSIAKLFQ